MQAEGARSQTAVAARFGQHAGDQRTLDRRERQFFHFQDEALIASRRTLALRPLEMADVDARSGGVDETFARVLERLRNDPAIARSYVPEYKCIRRGGHQAHGGKTQSQDFRALTRIVAPRLAIFEIERRIGGVAASLHASPTR